MLGGGDVSGDGVCVTVCMEIVTEDGPLVIVDTAIMVVTAVLDIGDCDATMKLLLNALLLVFGSSPTGIVATPHVRVCVPAVAIQGVCVLTVKGLPVGPG